MRSRLQREGRSIAQLSHSNIVAVFDMGTCEGQVFIAMELVEGGSLRQWLREEKRGWREVLEKFLAAGHGLAAAHRAGLAHRDFKPENVLVGRDGRVRVTDFGLAASTSAAPPVSFDSSPGNTEVGRLTRTGGLLGTPAYMSPEQYAGLGADALSDQFSFCVALWEAVFGARPYTPDIQPARWKFIEPPPSDVPPWLNGALRRGLSLTPSERYPTLEGLLLALSKNHEKPRAWRKWLAAGLGVAVAGLGSGYWAATRADRLCTGGAAQVASVWNPTVTQSLGTTFAASASDGAAVQRRPAASWTNGGSASRDLHRRCLATAYAVSIDQLLGLRMACSPERGRRRRAPEVFKRRPRRGSQGGGRGCAGPPCSCAATATPCWPGEPAAGAA